MRHRNVREAALRLLREMIKDTSEGLERATVTPNAEAAYRADIDPDSEL